MGKKARKNQKNEIESQTSTEDVFDPLSTEVANVQSICPNPALTSLTSSEILRIHVNNIGFSTTDDDIERFFSDCNPIKIKIVRGRGNSRCFCFVDFMSKSDFTKALDLDKSLLNGRQLHIRVAEKQISRHYSESICDAKNSIVRQLREAYSAEERFVRTSESLNSPSALAQRPKLVIAPRSISSEIEELPKRNPNIFGDALPVDTASKDREIEELIREKQRTESTVSNGEKQEDAKHTQPSKRLNMFKPKCSTSVSITSPGFAKPKTFFPPSSAKSGLPEEYQSKVESKPPALNIWEQRKQERAKQIQ
ncbi:Eukaryotic translation initiation factor 4B, partial [Cichlidogyrus casuarinus]